MLVHVLRAGLHAGWRDPGRCLSVQILRIPGKPSTFCYQSVVCFPLLSVCSKEERLSKPNSLAALFFIFGKLQPFYRQRARPVLSAEEGRTNWANKKE